MIGDQDPWGRCCCQNQSLKDQPRYWPQDKNKEKLDKITDLLRSWIGKQGHDSCWYYPEIFAQICAELGIEWKEPELPSRAAFEDGCCKFQEERYGKKIRCTICNDTQLVDNGLGDVEFCLCYYVGGRAY